LLEGAFTASSSLFGRITARMAPPVSPLGISLANLAVLQQQQRPQSVPQPAVPADANTASDTTRGQQSPPNRAGRGRLVDILA
jgi:hypothetical protein